MNRQSIPTQKMLSGEVVPAGSTHYRLHPNGKARTYFKQVASVWFEWCFDGDEWYWSVKTPTDSHMFKKVK